MDYKRYLIETKKILINNKCIHCGGEKIKIIKKYEVPIWDSDIMSPAPSEIEIDESFIHCEKCGMIFYK